MDAVNASLVYLLLRQVLQMLTQLARDGGAKEAMRRYPVRFGDGGVNASKRARLEIQLDESNCQWW